MIKAPNYSIRTTQKPPTNGWYKTQRADRPWRYRYYYDGKWYYNRKYPYPPKEELAFSWFGSEYLDIWAFLNEDDKKVVPLNVRFLNEA